MFRTYQFTQIANVCTMRISTALEALFFLKRGSQLPVYKAPDVRQILQLLA